MASMLSMQTCKPGRSQDFLLQKAFSGRRLTSHTFSSRRPLQQAKILSAMTTQRLKAKPAKQGTQRIAPARKPTAPKKMGTQQLRQPSVGTQVNRKLQSIAAFGEKGTGFRPRKTGVPRAAPTLLSRVEQLRLLSKAEQAGLLSLAERNGLTLSFIERSGLLSKAESLGLLTAATDRNTPVALTALALLLFVAGPAIVFLTPDSSSALIVAQTVAAAVAVGGGTAAWGGAALIGALQKD
ncbi:g1556 [Coccomyxa viridis]|uniref:G1556 protein n=1 Tax=Coccomyxa viridis TaxID=1274662 RepID=A0ABP1FJV9_9CHLO